VAIKAKPVTRLNVRTIGNDALVIAIQTATDESFYLLHQSETNGLIERLLVSSIRAALAQKREPRASPGGLEKVLSLPIETIAASHSPAKSTVGINLSLASGLRLTFEMPPQESMALSQQLQAAAGRAQVPTSQAKH
jgi:hypothetical protein